MFSKNWIGFMVCILISANILYSQDNGKQLMVITDATIIPAEVGNFNAAMKKQIEVAKKYKYPYMWEVYSTFDNHYYIVTPVKDFADIGNFFEAGKKVAKDGGEDFQSLMEKFRGTYEYTRQTVFSFEPKLSLIKEKQDTTAGQENFICWDFHYVKPGWEEEYKKVNEELQKLWKSKNASQQWYAHTGGMGTDGPLYVYVSTAKNSVDFWVKNSEMWEEFGEQGAKLYKKFMKYIRKREIKMGYFSKDLSYYPIKK